MKNGSLMIGPEEILDVELNGPKVVGKSKPVKIKCIACKSESNTKVKCVPQGVSFAISTGILACASCAGCVVCIFLKPLYGTLACLCLSTTAVAPFASPGLYRHNHFCSECKVFVG